LNEFNATLNTVPVVGIKDQTIMYVETKLNPNPLGAPVDQWSVFSTLPTGVTAGPNDKIHFYPYKADFYMSIGKKTWMKKHRQGAAPGAQEDPLLKKAVDNWPFLYETDWTYIGDNALPSDDLVAVMPFSVLSADRSQINFQLVLLNADSSLQVLDGDTLQGQNKWAQLSFKASDDGKTRPNWKLMAYWNNQLVGYDDNQNFWNLTPDWKARTYTIGDKIKIPEPISELTATEQGPVGIRADGLMWKRVVEAPKDDNDPATYSWKSWIRPDGVSKIGVASPGVILDLNLLTRTLKARYIDTQTAIIPLMNKIRAFGVTHKSYLTQLSAAADKWANNPDDPDKQAQAIKEGKGFVTHAHTWAKILESASTKAKDPVNIMTKQLNDVESQLVVQLTILNDKLAGLKKTLEAQEDYLSKMTAGFWSSIGAIFLGKCFDL
jgi:hypothetical protein